MDNEIIINEVKLIPYKNKQGKVKSFILCGIDSYPYREELKSLNGLWLRGVKNPDTSKSGVWGFSLKELDDVKDWANSYKSQKADNEINIVEFRDEWIEENDKKFLLLPLLYNLPTVHEVASNPKILASCMKECKGGLEAELLKNSVKAVEEGVYGRDDIIIIFKILDRVFKTSEADDLLRDSVKQLFYYLNDPLHHFLCLTGIVTADAINFSSKKFEALFVEVVRDNIVTEDERNYLIEKAEQYGVEKELLLEALERPKVYNSSFYFLVNEVCEDGIVTEAEKKFIYEKANEYNFDMVEVDKLLAERLLFYKKIINQKKDPNFINLLQEYFFLGILEEEKAYPSLNMELLNSIDVLLEEIEIIKLRRLELLFERFNFDSKNIRIELLCEILNIPVIKKLEFEDGKINDFKSEHTVQKVKINNNTYFIKLVERAFMPLFYHEFSRDDDKDYILINKLHEKYHPRSTDLMIELACSMYHTKHKMTSSDISIFIDRFNQNLKLIES